MKKVGLFAAALAAAVLFGTFGCEKTEKAPVFHTGEKSESEVFSGAETENGNAKETESAKRREEEQTDPEQRQTESSIYVYICGEVNDPGVVEVPEGARVFEAIEKAGGMTEDAAEFAVNQAALLSDGQQVTVPSLEEAAGWTAQESVQPFGGEEAAADGGKKVNINQAAADELMTLPGIGESKAEGIIEYRESAGGFESIEEIKNVSGIGDAVFEKLKDRIVI